MQANCGKLIKPNVPPNHNWSGDKVQKLAGQGDIYIRPTYLGDLGDSHSDVVSESEVHASLQLSYYRLHLHWKIEAKAIHVASYYVAI